MSGPKRIKLVVVGDGAVGKTCLLVVFAKGKFPEEYVPTVFENYTKVVQMKDGTNMSLDLWDTAGQEDFDRLRPLSYPDSDIVSICFSVVDRKSLVNARDKWHKEVNHHLRDIPLFLIGLKADLRDDSARAALDDPDIGDPIPRDEAEALAKDLKCVKYFEVSAKLNTGVNEVFEAAIQTVLDVRSGALIIGANGIEVGKPAGADDGADGGAGAKGNAKGKKKKTCSIL